MDHLHELTMATARFGELVGHSQGDEPVPACPGWDSGELVHHLGTIHRWAAAIVLSAERVRFPESPVDGHPAQWYGRAAAALHAALACVGVDEPVPNFSRIDETAGFWRRRQMHETTVHAVDLAQALGIAEHEWNVDQAIAADGIDEVFQVFFPRLAARGSRPDVRSRIRLVATDLEQSWIIAPGSDETAVPVQIHPSREADAQVSGTAVELYLALWRRLDHDRLTFDGPDAEALFAGPMTT